jgi:hypothetical protein
MRQISSLFLFSLFVFSGLIGINQVHAQRVLINEWPRGMVVLQDGDTLRGVVTYFRAEDLIQVQQQDGTMHALAPVNVYSFMVYAADNSYRQLFRSHMWNRGNDYSDFRSPAFFEQLSREGQYSLVKRETVVRRDMNQDMMFRRGMYRYDPYFMGGGMPRFVDQVQENFFLVSPEGKVRALRSPKKDIISAFDNKSRQVRAFIKQNKLTCNTSHDLIKVIAYYNSLLDQ